MKKHFSVIVAPHDNANVRNFRISYTAMYVLAGVVGLCVLSVVILLATFGRLVVKASRADRLADENARLVAETAQIDSLKTELFHVQALGLQIKTMLGLGLTAEDSTVVANLTPSVQSPSIADPFESVNETQDEQRELLEAIPSTWPVRGYVTREFDVTGGESQEHYHPGMDIAASRNTPVRASADGVVTSSGWDEAYGYSVVIDHGFGLSTVYGHNARNLVKVGDRVNRGQTIAFLGSTGKSTAPHLHFEVRKNGVAEDPRKYLLD
jgi:murein DD-endopeptidase MepM/ murein hydrolase activator NlpD